MKEALLILGNQLFPIKTITDWSPSNLVIYMREDAELCTYYRFHQHKIVFFLSAMRHYSQELKKHKFNIHYEFMTTEKKNYETEFLNFLKKQNIKKVHLFEIEDKFFEQRIIQSIRDEKIDIMMHTSPMFLNTRDDFKNYLNKTKKPFMKTFYEEQRKKRSILIEKNNKPVGGKWSFDQENRQPLPKDLDLPEISQAIHDSITKDVIALTETRFGKHPGNARDFWLPVTRAEALLWLELFLKDRLENFGPYEDAMTKKSDFVFHSVLTPFLNTGLLTPQEIVDHTLAYSQQNQVSLASVEGFIRQIIGWREFIRGIYQNFSEQQEESNFFNHQRKLTSHWYEGNTGIEPLDEVINKVNRLGYAHHIERLMVVGSLMLLLEIHPKEAHRWFMEMFIDSSDWVMGPNVYGMTLFSDGGIFSTKPYFCGSNYYRKMGKYSKDAKWCDGVDGLYWGFIDKHRNYFLSNPRLSMMVRTFDKMDQEKKLRIHSAGNEIKNKISQ